MDVLTNSKLQRSSTVWNNRNEIGRSNSEVVVVDLNTEMTVHGSVDEAEKILLAFLECPHLARTSRPIRPDVFTIQQVIACGWRSLSFSSVIFLKGCLIIRIANKDRAEIFVIVGRARPVNDDRSLYTITILSREMAVIPRSTILRCLEKICLGGARSKWAFSNTIDAILVIGIELTQSMPMDACTIVLHLVDNCDLDIISPIRFDCWAWNLTVDR